MRDINRIILHCSATPEGANFTAADIRSWHLARGWSDIGYHYVIGIDGTVESGRCISKQGAHTKGHNKDSIGICYIGGVDSDRNPKNTLTWDQRVSIKQLCRALRRTLNKPLYLHRQTASAKHLHRHRPPVTVIGEALVLSHLKGVGEAVHDIHRLISARHLHRAVFIIP